MIFAECQGGRLMVVGTALLVFLAAPGFMAAVAAAEPRSVTMEGESLGTDASAGLGETPLDRYVAARDGRDYSWRHVSQIEGKGIQGHVLELHSQNWRSSDEVDRVEWRHWLTLHVPPEVKTPTVLLVVMAGSNRDDPPAEPDLTLSALARSTGAVVAGLQMVPNQPLVFAGDGEERHEDEIIAWSWNRYLETGDETWPVQLAMVKSVVRAMDAIDDYSRRTFQFEPQGYVVTGASKRGWTSWLTAAADRRVLAVAPVVIDMLNCEPSMRHHREAYGFWSPALGDYESGGLLEHLGDPQVRGLLAFVDPWQLRARLTMPKFVINATGDQFFLPDSWRFYYDDLPGEKHLRYVPNADHGMGGHDVPQNIAAFFLSVAQGKPRPRFDWRRAPDGALELRVVDPPRRAFLWQATNPEARDFRLETIGPAWTCEEIPPQESGFYRVQVPEPDKGWTAFLVELVWDSPIESAPFKFSTGVSVVPDTLPHAGQIAAGTASDADPTTPPLLVPDDARFTREAAESFTNTALKRLAPVYPPLAEQIVRDYDLADSPGIGIDLGGGAGTLAIELAERTRRMHWVNVDINPFFFPDFLARAEERGVGGRVSALFGDATAMPLRDNYADVVVSRGCLQFWPDLEKGLAEALRILRPGGVALVGRGLADDMPVEDASRTRSKAGSGPKYDPDALARRLEEGMRDLNVEDFRIRRRDPREVDGVNYGVWVEFRKPLR